MGDPLSRRDFLRLAGAGVATALGAAWLPAAGSSPGRGAASNPARAMDAPIPTTPWDDDSPLKLGRVAVSRLTVRGGPGSDFPEWGQIYFDEVATVFGTVEGEALQRYNATWCNIGAGYVYSSFLQPVVEVYNPVEEVGDGFWGQITLPYVDSHDAPHLDAPVIKRLYCHALLWVRERAQDADGQWWYRLDSRRARDLVFWVPGDAVRRVPESEFTPIHPDVGDKRIVVDLGEQLLTCYEGSAPVLTQRVSSGARFIARAAGLDYRTRPGGYHVTIKRPSVHMVGGTENLDAYDLPGVPWVTFFNYTGIAIHGVYWHNDFGRPRSHGCVHVPPAVAQWIYRWTLPAADYRDFQITAHIFRPGTLIVVR